MWCSGALGALKENTPKVVDHGLSVILGEAMVIQQVTVELAREGDVSICY